MIGLLVLVVILVLVGGGWWGWPLVAGILGTTAVADKPTALDSIARLMRTYDITPDEVAAAYLAPASSQPARARRSKGDVAKTLFIYLGSIFILAGIGTYIGTFWDSMGSAMRVVVTLGTGYILLVVLVSALQEKKYPRVILPLALTSAVMMTSGGFVLIHEIFPNGDNWRLAVLTVFGAMALHQVALVWLYRRTVFTFTSLFFVYGALNVALDLAGIPLGYISIVLGASLFLVGASLENMPDRILAEPALLVATIWLNAGLFDRVAQATSANWAGVVTGVCIMSTAYGLQKAGRQVRLSGLGYFVGSILAYGGLFDLVRNTPVELVYLGVDAAMLYACVALQSRALLFTTVIAMLGFIGFYTSAHFANSLGWPVTLVLTGVAFLGVGTLAMNVKRRI